MIDRDPVHIYDEEELREPILVLAYAGWSDGGDAATTAVRALLDQLSVSRHAWIDTEEFLDFTVVRPHVRLREGRRREIIWPNHEFFGAVMGSQPSDLLLGLGVEPHLKWRAYGRAILDIATTAKVRLVVLLGALLDDVIYSQPIQVGVFSSDDDLARKLDLSPPTYEGPTGIGGVLADVFRSEGIPSVSLWARIPHYVPTKPNSRGALALLHKLEQVTGLRFDLSELEQEAASFDEIVSELIASDPQLTAYVRELKRRVFPQ